MALKNESILHISTVLAAALGNTQLGVEPTPDTDLNFRMWVGKDSGGNITKWIAKDKKARLASLSLLNLAGAGVGVLQHDANGNITGGPIAGYVKEDGTTPFTAAQGGSSANKVNANLTTYADVLTAINENTNYQLKTTSDDPIPAFLEDKIEAGTNVTLETTIDGGTGAKRVKINSVGVLQDFQDVTSIDPVTDNTITIPSLIMPEQQLTGAVGELVRTSEGFSTESALGQQITMGRTQTQIALCGEDIAKLDVVYFNDLPIDYFVSVKKAAADSYNENWTVAVAGNSGTAYVGPGVPDPSELIEAITTGLVYGVNTSAFLTGVPLYMDVIRGGITDVRPDFPARAIIVGTVAYSHATEGIIAVDVAKENYQYEFDGCVIEKQFIQLREEGGSIFCDVEKEGGGDLPVQLSSMVNILDCTTGPAPDGRATIELIQGTATVPQFQAVYLDLTGGIPVLKTTTSYPPVPFAPVAEFSIYDSVRHLVEGPAMSRQITTALNHDGRGRISYVMEWTTVQGIKYREGGTPSSTIDTGPSPDLIDFTSQIGAVYQNHRQTWPGKNVVLDGITVANASGSGTLTPRQTVNNLALLREQSNGANITNSRYHIVIFGAQNATSGESKIYANLPNGIYGGNDSEAYKDYNGTAITSVPIDLRDTAFLIARVPLFTNSAGTGFTFINPAGSPDIVSILGQLIGVQGSGTQAGAFIPTMQQVTDVDEKTTVGVDVVDNPTTPQQRNKITPEQQSIEAVGKGFSDVIWRLMIDGVQNASFRGNGSFFSLQSTIFNLLADTCEFLDVDVAEFLRVGNVAGTPAKLSVSASGDGGFIFISGLGTFDDVYEDSGSLNDGVPIYEDVTTGTNLLYRIDVTGDKYWVLKDDLLGTFVDCFYRSLFPTVTDPADPTEQAYTGINAPYTGDTGDVGITAARALDAQGEVIFRETQTKYIKMVGNIISGIDGASEAGIKFNGTSIEIGEPKTAAGAYLYTKPYTPSPQPTTTYTPDYVDGNHHVLILSDALNVGAPQNIPTGEDFDISFRVDNTAGDTFSYLGLEIIPSTDTGSYWVSLHRNSSTADYDITVNGAEVA